MDENAALSAAIGPVKPSWDQGDIVDEVYFAALDERLPAVLVTPACDIEQAKVDTWTFVALFPDVDVARALVAKDLDNYGWPATTVNPKQKVQLRKKMKELIEQRFPRYHWLPLRTGKSEGHVADLSMVTSLAVKEVKSLTRVASMRSSWREQLPARYVAYMGRVGTIDFDPREVEQQIDRLVEAVVAPQQTAEGTPGSG